MEAEILCAVPARSLVPWVGVEGCILDLRSLGSKSD